MYILIAEMLLALGVIIFIFWWTLTARIDHSADDSVEPDQTDAAGGAVEPEPKSDEHSKP